MKIGIATRRIGAIALILIFFALLSSAVYLFRRLGNLNREKLINQTSYNEPGIKEMWPLKPINNTSDSYSIRVVLQNEIEVGYIPIDDLIIRAWSIGIYKNRFNKTESVIIPRAWENTNSMQLFFASSTKPEVVEGYTDKFLIGIIKGVDAHISDRQRVATAIFFPTDPDRDIALRTYFKSLSDNKLPSSFINDGVSKDLPQYQGRAIFPANDLMFNLPNKNEVN